MDDDAHIDRTLDILAMAAAMGWAYRGDIDKARHFLAKLSPEHLSWVSASASLLASLADEMAERRA